MTAITLDTDRIAHLKVRLLADLMLDGLAATWNRTADRFEWAAHRPGIDYPGRATAEELDAQRARCLNVARLARHRAQLEHDPELTVPPIVWATLAEGVRHG